MQECPDEGGERGNLSGVENVVWTVVERLGGGDEFGFGAAG